MKASNATAKPAKLVTPTIRCAVYTRKSTEEGLEKEFNSLDAQRESGELFVRSQAGEGWTLVPDAYDDGGFTGGNMERPALRRLMLDIEAGKVDAVVVYKVDRLSRSLLDFARMMQVFDSRKVSFVSVTQQFNTATSMGRLVLNVLLSFAQFEREIISERTRDKIAATRRKGKWAGGHPILGYDIDPAFKLAVNPLETERVRNIFELYLDRESLMPAVQALAEKGWVNKRWTTRKGHERGGMGFTRTSLYKLLTNVAYAGKVRYRDEVHPGEHPAIVEADLWQRVQALLARNGRTGGAPGAGQVWSATGQFRRMQRFITTFQEFSGIRWLSHSGNSIRRRWQFTGISSNCLYPACSKTQAFRIQTIHATYHRLCTTITSAVLCAQDQQASSWCKRGGRCRNLPESDDRTAGPSGPRSRISTSRYPRWTSGNWRILCFSRVLKNATFPSE